MPESTPQMSPEVNDDPGTEILLPRRYPSQDRSRKKYQALLTAAREVLVEVGIDSFTCEEVASRAGVPIGTLYQFFANKYVIVCELDRQDAHGVIAELESFASKVPAPDWPELLNDFLDHLAHLWGSDPSRRAVWLATQATPGTRATAAVNEQELASIIAKVLAPLTPSTERSHRAFMAEVLVHVAYSVLNFSVRNSSDSETELHEQTITELKRMLAAYLWLAERESSETDQH